MRIGVIGAGRIGGNCARQAVKAGHEVKLSFARDPAKLDELAYELGDRASTGTVDDAVAFGEIVIVSVPWGVIPEALAQACDLTGKVVIDTTNQFGSGPQPEPGQTAAEFNARRMPAPATSSRSTPSPPASRSRPRTGTAPTASSNGFAATITKPKNLSPP
jgi:predicted dinucleotide-binding enzyme